jgi:predicted enzyme related to lactoylglutathione lyase
MSHRFVWVDIPVRDLDRAIEFYAAVLGTPVTREGGPGFSFGLLAHSGSDVAGCLYLADDGNAPSARGPLVYLNVDGRIVDAERAVAARGGRIVESTHAIAPHGYRAIVLDSEGNRIALHSASR